MSRCTLLKLTPSVASRFIFILFLAFAPAHAQDEPELTEEEKESLAPPFPISRTVEGEPIQYDPKEAERFRVLRGALRPEPRKETELYLQALEGFLDYDEEQDILYGPGRTRIEYGKFILEADRVIIDNRLQEIQAEGNVELRTLEEEDTPENVIYADSMRYNFAAGEGIGFNVSGKYPPLRFITRPDKDDPTIPPFQQVSPEESLFRNTSISTCDFIVPHYFIRAREVILFQSDRVFFRKATFYVMGAPVMYLPFYSRSLRGGSPWFFRLGYGSETGFRIRAGYEYEHRTAEPTFEDEDVYLERSEGQAQVFIDTLTERGIGLGFNYKYQFDYERHRGEMSAYAIDDTEREVTDQEFDIDEDDSNEQEESDRAWFYWRHRSQLTEDLSAIINVDWFSDPEIFFDILDHFVDNEFERERQMERRARLAVTYLREAYVARLLVEVKDRIGIDRYGDFSDPANNNFDFDMDPGVELEDSDANSIAHSRWGRVTERLPQFTFATRYLPIQDWPFYLLSEVNAYNNLDKGINIVDEDDDSRVTGIEAYNAALWQYRITERYILLARIGVGLGSADREDSSLGIEPIDLKLFDTINLIDDDGEFLVGEEDFNLDDIETFYAWVDSQVRLNARFSDALTGFVRWRWRETTDDFIGDFYAQIGDYTSREDLFNYKLREHWLEGNLTYSLLYPALTAYANAGVNLTGHDDLFPNENLSFWSTGLRWANQRQTLTAGGGFGQSERQFFHPTDPREGTQTVTTIDGRIAYAPIHGRWYTRLTASKRYVEGEEAEPDNEDEFTFFSEEDDRLRVRWTYGRVLSPKWETEISLAWDSRLDGFRDISWLLQRDMHDALAILRLRVEQDLDDADDAEDNEVTYDVSFGMKLKLPNEPLAFGADEIKTLRERERQPVTAY